MAAAAAPPLPNGPSLSNLKSLLKSLVPIYHHLVEKSEDDPWEDSVQQVVQWYTQWAREHCTANYQWQQDNHENQKRSSVVALDEPGENILILHRYQAYTCLHKCYLGGVLSEGRTNNDLLLHYACLFAPYIWNAERFHARDFPPLHHWMAVGIDDQGNNHDDCLLDCLLQENYQCKHWNMVTSDATPVVGKLMYALCSFELETRIDLSECPFDLLSPDPVLTVRVNMSDASHQDCECYFIHLHKDPLMTSTFWADPPNIVQGITHCSWMPVENDFLEVPDAFCRHMHRLCERTGQNIYRRNSIGFEFVMQWLRLVRQRAWQDAGVQCKNLQCLLQREVDENTMCTLGQACKNGDPLHHREVRHVKGTGPFHCYLPPSPQYATCNGVPFYIAYAVVSLLHHNTCMLIGGNHCSDPKWRRFSPGLDQGIEDTARRSLPPEFRSLFQPADHCKYIDVVNPKFFRGMQTTGLAYRIYLQHVSDDVLPILLPRALRLLQNTNIGIAHNTRYIHLLSRFVLPALQNNLDTRFRAGVLSFVTHGGVFATQFLQQQLINLNT